MTPTSYPVRRATAVAVLLGMLAVVLSVLPAASAAAEDRPLSSTALLTWNMQGANEAGANNNKWQNVVRRYARQFPILMLQEAGAAPAESATRLADLTRTTVGRNGTIQTHTVQHYSWNLGTDTRPEIRDIYFLLTQNGVGGRVNLAMVVSGQPDEVNVVQNPVDAGRTALGVRSGAHWYFTVHGLSGGGGDSAVLLDAIDDQVTAWATTRNVAYNWTVGGDFNVDPTVLVGRGDFPVARTLTTDVNTPTHNSGNRLDFFVTDDFSADPGGAWVVDVPPSDHRPVAVGRMRAAGAAPSSVRLMPIGDSITEGHGSSNQSGFRDELQDDLGKITIGQLLGTSDSLRLYEPGFKRDLVGRRQHGQGIPDGHHHGWPGYTIEQIAEETPEAVQALRPNVVTLLAGTTDMARNVDVTGAPARLSRLIDQIFTGSPGVAIVVGTLTPSRESGIQGRIAPYNAAIRKMLDDRIARGDHLVRVDLSAVTSADLADQVHPSDRGYRKIADAFTAGIRTAMINGWIGHPAQIDEAGSCTTRGGYRSKGQVWAGLSGDQDFAGQMKYGDMNGDGRDDIVRVAPTGVATVWLNRMEGGTVAFVQRAEFAMGTGASPERVFLADLDGDRKDDYIVVRADNNFMEAYINKGGNSNDPMNWQPGFETQPAFNQGTPVAIDRLRFADLDGEGRADLIRLLDFNTKVDVFLNQGGSGWMIGAALTLTNLKPRANKQIEFADLNCDSRADYIALDAQGVPNAWFNTGGTGSFWTERGKIAAGTSGVVAMPELNGDGRADWVRIARNGAIDAWFNNGGD